MEGSKNMWIGIAIAVVLSFGANAFMLWKINKKADRSEEWEKRYSLYRDSMQIIIKRRDSLEIQSQITSGKIAEQDEKIKKSIKKIGAYKRVSITIEQAKKDLGL